VNSSFRCVIHMTGFPCVVVNRIINSGVETIYACLPSPGIVLPSGRFKPGLNNTSHSTSSQNQIVLFMLQSKTRCPDEKVYNNKGSPPFIRELLTDFSFLPPAVGPQQQSLTNGIFFCLFLFYFLILVSPVTTTTFPFDGGLSRLCIFAESISRVSVCERRKPLCVTLCMAAAAIFNSVMFSYIEMLLANNQQTGRQQSIGRHPTCPHSIVRTVWYTIYICTIDSAESFRTCLCVALDNQEDGEDE
jgi:hypothetical protein